MAYHTLSLRPVISCRTYKAHRRTGPQKPTGQKCDPMQFRVRLRIWLLRQYLLSVYGGYCVTLRIYTKILGFQHLPIARIHEKRRTRTRFQGGIWPGFVELVIKSAAGKQTALLPATSSPGFVR